MLRHFLKTYAAPLIICLLFFAAYLLLGLVRQSHFWSGYDLAIIDQAIWEYGHFTIPITTINAYAFTPILTDHVELIFLFVAPLYWIFDNVKTLIILQSLVICSSGFAVYLLAKERKLVTSVSLSLTVSYLMFYGIQNAIWADVHSLVFGVSFLAWFLYFLTTKRLKLSWVFFLLAILSKEDMALLTLLASGIFFLQTREKRHLIFMAISSLYLFAIFFVYFPHFVAGGYRFERNSGLLSNLQIQNLYNTANKREVFLYSSLSFGFLPFLSPLYLLLPLADLVKYFVVANSVVTSGQSLFGHYRSSLAILLVWPTIMAIAKFKKLNNILFAGYILLFALIVQYQLHLPLSYLTKQWFWTKPQSTTTIEKMLRKIPDTASIVTQVNILPHISHRTYVFLAWPNTKDFTKNSPCGKKNCVWFRWSGSPHYLLVDTSPDWNVLYWLTDRDTFIAGLNNLEKAGVIAKKESLGTTTLYTVLKKP